MLVRRPTFLMPFYCPFATRGTTWSTQGDARFVLPIKKLVVQSLTVAARAQFATRSIGTVRVTVLVRRGPDSAAAHGGINEPKQKRFEIRRQKTAIQGTSEAVSLE